LYNNAVKIDKMMTLKTVTF